MEAYTLKCLSVIVSKGVFITCVCVDVRCELIGCGWPDISLVGFNRANENLVVDGDIVVADAEWQF